MDMMDPSASQHLPLLANFWQTHLNNIEHGEIDFKNYNLPLARIKKVMKTDEDVKHMMISAEAPIVFAKACEIFILELTLRSWLHTDECKRRTLQRNDVAIAISRSDTFDFLIDIVPREESKMKKSDYGSSLVTNPGNYFYGNNTSNLAAPFQNQIANNVIGGAPSYQEDETMFNENQQAGINFGMGGGGANGGDRISQ